MLFFVVTSEILNDGAKQSYGIEVMFISCIFVFKSKLINCADHRRRLWAAVRLKYIFVKIRTK